MQLPPPLEKGKELQAMNLPSASNLFPSSGMGAVDRRPSPAHPNIQPANPTGGQPPPPPPQSRQLTIPEMTERVTTLRVNIKAGDAALARFIEQQRVGVNPDPATVNKMRQVAQDLRMKKEYLKNLVITMQSMGVNVYAHFLTSCLSYSAV
jgi:hypothetical protein